MSDLPRIPPRLKEDLEKNDGRGLRHYLELISEKLSRTAISVGDLVRKKPLGASELQSLIGETVRATNNDIIQDIVVSTEEAVEKAVEDSTAAIVDTTAPTAITGFSLSAAVQEAKLYVNATITATWNASTDPSGLFYEIQYWLTSDSTKVESSTTTNTTFKIFPAQVGVEYTVRVRAVDYWGNATAYATSTITPGNDLTAPANVTGVTGIPGVRFNLIKWTNPTDTDFIETVVHRGTTSGFTPDSSNKVYQGRAESFVDEDLTIDIGYFYKFAARDVSGNQSSFSSASGPFTPFGIDNVNITNYVDALAIQSTQIANAAILTDKLADLNITLGKLASNSVDTSKIVNDAITNVKIAAAAVEEAKIATDAVTAVKIQANAVTTAKIDALAVTAAKIAANAIETDKLAANAVTAAKIAANTITANEIAAATITTTQIAADTIIAGNIAASAIGTDELAANAVTAGKIAANTITAAQIAANTITANEIAAATITGAKIAASTITASNLSVSQLSAITADLGTITAGTVTGATIRTSASNPRVQLDSTNGIQSYDSGGNQRVSIATDGSGWFGSSSAFSWTTAGVLSVAAANVTGTLTGNTIQTSSSNPKVILDSTNGLRTLNSSGTVTSQLKTDGSGFLGASSGATGITWDTAGNVTINSLNVVGLFYTYTTTKTSGTSTVIPTGSRLLVIRAWGGGGGGARNGVGLTSGGGGGGGGAKKTVQIRESDWGQSITYTVGAGGPGRTGSNGNGTAGGTSTVTSSGLSFTNLNISAGGGGAGTTSAGGSGGTASGGDTNQSGVAGIGDVAGSGGNSGTIDNIFGAGGVSGVSAATEPGGGGAGAEAGNGGNGASGMITFTWSG